MITALSTLTSLKEFRLKFQSPLSRPGRENPRSAPSTRFVLPVLTYFLFKGVSEYLDDLVARIDAPQLNTLQITFFNQIVFDAPQLVQFVGRTPTLKLLERVDVVFTDRAAEVKLSSQTSGSGRLNVKISCREIGWQVSSMEQVCTSCLPPLFTSEKLYIYGTSYWLSYGLDNIGDILWQELLQPFTAVKNLYLSHEFASHIVSAMQELTGGGMTEVLPTLQNIYLEGLQPSGPVQENLQQFVASRQASRPIAVSRWDKGRIDGTLAPLRGAPSSPPRRP